MRSTIATGILIALVAVIVLSPIYKSILAQSKPPAKNSVPKLVEMLKRDEPAFVDLSSDGRFVLTSGHRKVPCSTRGQCKVPTLAVYDAQSHVRVGEVLGDPSPNFVIFYAPHFHEGLQVRTFESRYNETLKRRVVTGIQWDPMTNARSTFDVINTDAEFIPACSIDSERTLGIDRKRSSQSGWRLAVLDSNGALEVQQPDTPRLSNDQVPDELFLEDNCRAFRYEHASDMFLVRTGSAPASSLYWVSVLPEKAPRFCRTFPNESLDGHAVSPDGQFIVAITSTVTKGVEGGPVPEFRAFLNVLKSDNCEVAKRSELEFPEGLPRWKPPLIRVRSSHDLLDNVHFGQQFAKHLAISPDSSKLALAYGHFKDPHGYAFFGIYALPTGQRLTTLRGEVYKAGIWHGALLSDELYAPSAPITGTLQFSPDSRILYASSKYLFEWDVSGLK